MEIIIIVQRSDIVAVPEDAYEDNIGGFSEIGGKKVSFYVDAECIICSVCSDCAPKNFMMADDADHDICFKQPETMEELEQCYEAMECCPVEAIGDDGLDAQRAN
jgi:ferredoxin